MSIFEDIARRKIAGKVIDAVQEEIRGSGADQQPADPAGYRILRHDKNVPKLTYPIFLIGILGISIAVSDNIDGTRRFADLNIMNWLTLVGLVGGLFILGPLWLLVFWKTYELKYNDDELIIRRFGMKKRKMIIKDITKASFYENEGSLYLTDKSGFVRINDILKGYKRFETQIGKSVTIERFEK